MNLLSTLPAWLIAALRLNVPVDPEIMRPPDEIVACEERLENSGVTFTPSRIPVHSSRGGFLCGAPQVVKYVRGPGNIKFSSKAKMSCPLALAFAKFEQIIQEEAQDHLGQPVAKITHVGTYNCREMALYEDFISEHSYANGMDIRSFILKDGTELTIGKDYFDENEGGEFLRALANRIYDEGVFSVVMTPNADSLHKTHLHVDMAHYRFDGT